VNLPASIGIADLEKVQSGHESAYPTRMKRVLTELEGRLSNDGAAASARSNIVGYLFKSADENQVFQARLDGFALSRLKPYESWKPFRDEARRLWDVYRSVAKPTRVTRVAVRYINRLDLPLPVQDLKDYLRTAPEVSSDLPQELAGYFLRLELPFKDIASVLVVNQTIVAPATPNVASVVLDVDVFRVDDLPPDEQSMWDFFEVLRARKNEVFEACITDRARELFR
jgi:uncharacterized protein (TIGR04255 family)